MLEPGRADGALKTKRKGIGRFTLTVSGQAAHAAAWPGQGVSALEELAHQILRLHGLTDPAAGTSVSVGVAGRVRAATSWRPRRPPRSICG